MLLGGKGHIFHASWSKFVSEDSKVPLMAGNLQHFGKQVINLGAYFCACVSNFSQTESGDLPVLKCRSNVIQEILHPESCTPP